MRRYGLICKRPGYWLTPDNGYAVVHVMQRTSEDSWEVYKRLNNSRKREWWIKDGDEIAVNLFTFRDAATTLREHIDERTAPCQVK